MAHVLRPLRELFMPAEYPDLLVGLGSPDDAAVWRLSDNLTLVVTTDFFTPVVDDPYDYGSISAANALSDLYAMGATPILALNIVAMPPDLPDDIVGEILRGGAEKVKEAGAVIAGGHTIQDPEPKYGLVALGTCVLDRLMTKSEAKPGDVLILTKPLGTGVTTTALKHKKADSDDIVQVVTWMKKLNASAANLAAEFGVQAATDVTGFSLLGHGVEMAEASSVAFRLHLPSIPFLSGARRYAEGGNFPGGTADNRMYFSDRVRFKQSIDEYDQMLLFDAQTSGGLLLALERQKVNAFLGRADEEGVDVWPIGEVVEGEGIEVLDKSFDEQRHRDATLWFSMPES
ncbi:MAG: selenide, water dikinase [Anaerolineae bacterium SM23_ 63]|nr:MAG: selenide, water dikinase [Anaerolineae bacterium SM23_ 63]